MRCLSCDNRLTEFESTRRYASSRQFVDLCNECFRAIAGDVLVVERTDLKKTQEVEDGNEGEAV